MGARDLLTELTAAGLTLNIDGERLIVAPRDRLTDAMRDGIKALKPELMTLLAGERDGPLATVARHMPTGAREVLDCLLSFYDQTGGLQLRDLAEAARLPIGVVIGALNLLHGAGLVTRSRGYWSPAAALRRELAATDRHRLPHAGTPTEVRQDVS